MRRLLVVALHLTVLAGCGGAAPAASGADPVTVRLGYFPNLTHAPALVGIGEGIFEQHFEENVTMEPKTFNAGPEAIEAIFSGALDISYIGSNPAINAHARSNGEAIRIIAGSTSGGAALVVSAEINEVGDLEGKRLATPQLGNTQDVALRSWLADEGFKTDTAGGGEVSILPQANGDALTAFKAGRLDGAWVPEPWVTRLVQEGNGHVLVDESDLWPGGRFVTTHVVVRTEFLKEHPRVVRQFLNGHLAALDFLAADAAKAKASTNAAIAAITDQPLADAVLNAAWENLQFTADPVAFSLSASAKHAEDVGLLEPVDLDGIYDLRTLNQLLTARNETEVKSR